MTEEIYEEKRKEILQANSNLLGIVLNEKECQLDRVLSALKAEYRQCCNGTVPYHVPVLTDPVLTSSRLYRFCTMMPKGADLHVHDMAQLPRPQMNQLLMTRDEFCIRNDQGCYDLIRVDPGQKVPEGYLRFRDALESGAVTEEGLVRNYTVVGAEKQGINVWDWFEGLFKKNSFLSDSEDFVKAYYDHVFRYYISRGIYHMEIHMLLKNDLEKSAAHIKAVRQAYYDVKKQVPFFFVKIIGAGPKADGGRLETTKKCFLNTLYARENIRDCSDPEHITDFVIGFDLVSEEDTHLPLKVFSPMLLKMQERYPDIKLFIHSGESLDARNDNLIDAYLLGVSRVGHGLNLYRYPDLLERYAKSEICLEVCVISNQTLGYTKDVRNHPAVEYLRRGVAVALCSDDPAYQENETLTDDFFAAALCWDLTVADLKHLCINSIMYSGLDQVEKDTLLKAYHQKWDAFVEEALTEFSAD